MSIEEKLNNVKKTTWLTDGIPKWKVPFIVFSARLKAKIYLILKRKLKIDLYEIFGGKYK